MQRKYKIVFILLFLMFLQTGCFAQTSFVLLHEAGNQTIPPEELVHITFNDELEDTLNEYNIDTREFTPTVSGYYEIGLSLQFTNTQWNNTIFRIYLKNSSMYNMIYNATFDSYGLSAKTIYLYRIVYMDSAESYSIWIKHNNYFSDVFLNNFNNITQWSIKRL